VGDLLYDRTIRSTADRNGDAFIFSCIAEELQKYDLVVANLENPITDNPSVSLGSEIGSPNNYRFTAPLRTASVLAANNIRLVSIGNNHMYDYGSEGVAQTRAAVRAARVETIGDPTDSSNTSTTTVVNSIPITFVAFNEFFGSRAWTQPVLESIPQASTTIVFAHWGDEYETQSASRQRAWAHSFVDAGADLVVGHHPHVVQESEQYNNAPIYYSLGNFIFDNYERHDTTRGLALEVHISERGITQVIERPLILTSDRRTCFQ
jgi:poly-gamma-glutamate synthesis protein (capsule biosynthesis protein)